MIIVNTDNYYTILNRIFTDIGYDVENMGLYNAIEKIKNELPKSTWYNIASSVSFTINSNTSLLNEIPIEAGNMSILCHLYEEKISDKNFYIKMTLCDLLLIIENIDNKIIIPSDKFKKDILNIVSNFPKVFFYMNNFLENAKFIGLKSNMDKIYPNYRDNILFLTDLNDLEYKLQLHNSIKNPYKMYNISMRLFIPYYTIDNIFKNNFKYSDLNISYYSPLYNTEISCDIPKYNQTKPMTKLMELSNTFINSIDRDKFIIPSTMYNCFINCSLNTLGQILTYWYTEINSSYPVLSGIYYYILNMKLAYPNIYNAIKFKNPEEENRLVSSLVGD